MTNRYSISTLQEQLNSNPIANRQSEISNYKFQIANWKFQIANSKAERVGFEPTVQFPVHSISSAASSATPAPLPDFRLWDCRFGIADFRFVISNELKSRPNTNRAPVNKIKEQVNSIH